MLPVASVFFAPGLVPVLKHGDHNQKDHGRRGSGGSDDSVPFGVEELAGSYTITYGEMDIFRTPAYGIESTVDEALGTWGYWDGNYTMRTVSANMMGIKRPESAGGDYVDLDEQVAYQTGRHKGLYDGARQRVEDRVFETYAIMDSVRKSEPTDLPLYRGMSVKEGSAILKVKPGDEFTVPLSAFSYEKNLASRFTDDPGEPVMLRVRPGAKGARSSENYWNSEIEVGGEWRAIPDEIVSQGTFKVNAVSQENGVTVIDVTHEQYFDVGSGRFEPVE